MKLKCLSILLFICIGIGYGNINIEASEPSIYSKMLTPSPLGKDRILIVCSITNNDRRKLNQFYKSVLWDKFVERDLVVVEVSKRIVSTVLRVKGRHDDVFSMARHHDYGDKLREKANCENEIELILIGKDTGVKARWTNGFTQEDLFSRIDAMPMRKFEMRQKQGKN